MWGLGIEPGSLEEQPVLLTMELSLQPQLQTFKADFSSNLLKGRKHFEPSQERNLSSSCLYLWSVAMAPGASSMGNTSGTMRGEDADLPPLPQPASTVKLS